MIKIKDGPLYRWDTGRKIKITPLYRMDAGRKIKITSLEDCPVKAVEYCSCDSDILPLPVKPEIDGEYIVANIPNILLQDPYDIDVYFVTYSGSDRRTTYNDTLTVTDRPMPSDYVYEETEILNYKVLEDRIRKLEFMGGSGGSSARIGYVTLLADAWAGEGKRFGQIVEIDGVTEKTQVDLKPSADQLVAFLEKNLAFVAENEEGIVTVCAIGQKPMNDYTIQVTMMEMSGDIKKGKIIGVTVGTTMDPQASFDKTEQAGQFKQNQEVINTISEDIGHLKDSIGDAETLLASI